MSTKEKSKNSTFHIISTNPLSLEAQETRYQYSFSRASFPPPSLPSYQQVQQKYSLLKSKAHKN